MASSGVGGGNGSAVMGGGGASGAAGGVSESSSTAGASAMDTGPDEISNFHKNYQEKLPNNQFNYAPLNINLKS